MKPGRQRAGEEGEVEENWKDHTVLGRSRRATVGASEAAATTVLAFPPLLPLGLR